MGLIKRAQMMTNISKREQQKSKHKPKVINNYDRLGNSVYRSFQRTTSTEPEPAVELQFPLFMYTKLTTGIYWHDSIISTKPIENGRQPTYSLVLGFLWNHPYGQCARQYRFRTSPEGLLVPPAALLRVLMRRNKRRTTPIACP